MMCASGGLCPCHVNTVHYILFIRALFSFLSLHLLCIWIYMVLYLSSMVFYSVDLASPLGLLLMGALLNKCEKLPRKILILNESNDLKYYLSMNENVRLAEFIVQSTRLAVSRHVSITTFVSKT